jgi:hypothetical protein
MPQRGLGSPTEERRRPNGAAAVESATAAAADAATARSCSERHGPNAYQQRPVTTQSRRAVALSLSRCLQYRVH